MSETRDLPPPPTTFWRLAGPGIVGAGVGLSSGEFILWPYIVSQSGLMFVWAAVVGVITQFFLNMEIERYTLATGETSTSGFNRHWRHWGLVFAVMTYFANLWPGWALSSATLATYLMGGGNPRMIAIATLVVIGLALTLAPVVYVALERLIFVKVAAVIVLVVSGVAFAIDANTWRALPGSLLSVGQIPANLSLPLLFGALAFAGGGGGQNLCQSHWIRDKGFGMGRYAPRVVSPITGQEESTPSVTRYEFEPTPENLSRWRAWWRFANVEQLLSFVLITIVTIGLTSMLSHSMLFGQPDLPNNITFLNIEAGRLSAVVGGWFGILFLAVGALSLFGSAMGIIDYTSRLAADVIKTAYLRHSAVSESRLYFWLVWALVAIGSGVLLTGFAQPLALLVISACVGAAMMFLYSFLLIVLNRQHLPRAIGIRGPRIAVLVWSTILFGTLTAVTIWTQVTSR